MAGPFGVELPETFEAPSSAAEPTAREASNAGESTPARETEANKPQVDPFDLDSLERFRFQGRELSKDDLQKLLTGGQESASESTNAKFDQNFRFDLDTVLADPSKLALFRQIYPPEYVAIAEKAMAQQRAQASPVQQQNSGKPSEDPRISRLEKIADQWENAQREQRVESLKGTLDKTFDSLSKKYPEADQEVINSRLFAMRQSGTQLQDQNGKLRNDIIEDLFKRDHAAREKRYEDKYRQKVEDQKRVNSNARDVGKGGSASSPAPGKAKNIKEATAAALAHFEGT